MVKPLLIVKAGETYADMAARFGDFEDWISTGLERSTDPIATVRPFCGEALPDPLSLGGIIITGSMDAHHAFAIGRRAWGVQFHPEFNSEVMRCCIQHLGADRAVRGADVPARLAGVREAPQSREVPRRFEHYCFSTDSR